MMKTKNRPCPICNQKNNKILYIQRFNNALSHKISCCKNCGFVFVSNTPNQNHYNNYYKKMSKYEHERDGDLHKDYLNLLKKHCHKNFDILDIGCSTGHLLSLFKKEGYKNLCGIDPSPMCKKLAFQKHKILVKAENLYSYKPAKKFDLIILAAVLEHLVEVKLAINKTFEWLKEEGLLFISVPDVNCFNKNLQEPFGEFSTEHINFFSPSSLYQIMGNHTLIETKTMNSAFCSIWQKGTKLEKIIKSYLTKSTSRLLKLKGFIDKLPNNLIVWSAGSLTRRLLETTSLKKKAIKFVDINKNLVGKKLEGKNIVLPEELYKYPKNPILVSSYRFKDEIINQVGSMKLKNKIYTFK